MRIAEDAGMNRSVFCFFLFACGGTPATSTSETLPGQPPPPPNADEVVPPSADVTTFAIDHLFLGDRTRAVDAADSQVWKSFGYDLDHKKTTKDSTNVCTLQGGAPKMNQVDGNDGIDDAFGAMVVPLLETAVSTPTPSDALTDAFTARRSTLQIQVTGLPADPTATAIGLRASTFVGADASKSSDAEWPMLDGTEADFLSAYVNRGTFVSASGSFPVRLDLPFDFTLPLQIQDAVITFTRSGDIIEGTIAGVLDAIVFGEAVRDFTLRAAPLFCDSTTFSIEGLVALIREAADMQTDGTNASGVTCGGISIGLQFTAHRIANPSTTVGQVVEPPACN